MRVRIFGEVGNFWTNECFHIDATSLNVENLAHVRVEKGVMVCGGSACRPAMLLGFFLRNIDYSNQCGKCN
jgi:hypothetical protein